MSMEQTFQRSLKLFYVNTGEDIKVLIAERYKNPWFLYNLHLKFVEEIIKTRIYLITYLHMVRTNTITNPKLDIDSVK